MEEDDVNLIACHVLGACLVIVVLWEDFRRDHKSTDSYAQASSLSSTDLGIQLA